METDPTGSPLRRCPKCSFEQSSENSECRRCGVIFAKLEDDDDIEEGRFDSDRSSPDESETQLGTLLARVRQRVLTPPARTHGSQMLAGGLIWLALLVLGWSFITASLDRSQVSPSLPHFILSRANLVFHEAGHVVFRPLGQFMATLGGSLLQVLVPLICMAAFLTRHLDTFAASVTLWWAGQNLIEVALYINDARAQQLMLLGGVTGRDRPGYHDWNNLLSQLGYLHYDHFLAKLAHQSGAILILLSLVWGLYLLRGQYDQQRSGRGQGVR